MNDLADSISLCIAGGIFEHNELGSTEKSWKLYSIEHYANLVQQRFL